MPQPAAERAQDIAVRLKTVGYEPRITHEKDRIRIEADVSEPVSPDRWHQLLAVLDRADRFGLDGTADGRTAWAAVQADALAAPDSARGHGPQL